MSTVNDENRAAPDAASLRDTAPSANMFEGEFVSVSGVKLVMKSKAGKQYSHTLAKDAKLTCDGTPCKAEDFKAGSKIRVTTTREDRKTATGIDALDKYDEFAKCGG